MAHGSSGQRVCVVRLGTQRLDCLFKQLQTLAMNSHKDPRLYASPLSLKLLSVTPRNILEAMTNGVMTGMSVASSQHADFADGVQLRGVSSVFLHNYNYASWMPGLAYRSTP